jgi:hypothetical protein
MVLSSSALIGHGYRPEPTARLIAVCRREGAVDALVAHARIELGIELGLLCIDGVTSAPDPSEQAESSLPLHVRREYQQEPASARA